MTPTRSLAIRPISALLLPALLAGCSPFRTEAPPSYVSLPARFDQIASTTAPTDLTRWWTAWNDPQLTHLVEDALAANTDLRISRARITEARAYAAVARSALYPTVAATGNMIGGGMSWRNPGLAAQLDPNLGDPATDAHLAGVGLTWEPDVFGGRHADTRAAQDVALAAEEMLHGVRMAVAADVAGNYLAALGVTHRIALLDEAVRALNELNRYARARFNAGQATSADIETITGQIHAMEARRPLLALGLDTHRRRLALLAGRPPEQAPVLTQPVQLRVPPLPQAALPSDLLERRPDIRLQRARVDAALQRLASSKTDLLPRFGLEFFGGNGRLRFDGIPGLSGSGGLVALNAWLPLFTAGRIKAGIKAADARLEEAVASYDQTLLTALGEIENAAESRTSLDANCDDLTQEVASATRAVSEMHGLFEGGRMTLQNVLEARLRLIDAQDRLVVARTERALATVKLARALGGGWEAP